MVQFNLYKDFTRTQFVNMAFYIGGILFYKFALETMNTCIFNLMVRSDPTSKHLSFLWTVLQSINYATQCLGSLAVAPLIRRFRPNHVQAAAISLFGVVIAVIPILEVSTGGTLTQRGDWSQYILFAIFPIVGFFHGIIELIRRVIPSDIVGNDELNLKRMDSTVHILYEVAGTSGALLARYWIGYFKYAYALFFLPISFSIAAVLWCFIKLEGFSQERAKEAEKEIGIVETEGGEKKTFLQDLKAILISFFYAVWVGAKLVCGHRSLIWLLPAYTLPLVLHRYIENTLFPFYATYVLGVPSLSQILLAGSNLGELLGAALVLFFTHQVKTPLPWLRSDAFTLSILWILPYAVPFEGNAEGWVWALFPAMIFLSMGWASGDVSLSAYVQSRLSTLNSKVKNISPLGAVMAFLYVSYIVMFPILAYGMGIVMDQYRLAGKPQEAFIYIAGVFLTICGVVIFLSTFIPRGAFAFNPEPVEDETLSLGGDSQETKEEIEATPRP